MPRLLNGAWSLKHAACIRCGKTSYKHKCGGVCSSCFEKARYRPVDRYAWSLRFPSCISCGRTDSPHSADGRCRKCHRHFLYRQSLNADEFIDLPEYRCFEVGARVEMDLVRGWDPIKGTVVKANSDYALVEFKTYTDKVHKDCLREAQ